MQPTRLQTGIWLCCRCPVEVAIRWRLDAELRANRKEPNYFLLADHPPCDEPILEL